jgi:nucleotide-binding universal stress UspA family protein
MYKTLLVPLDGSAFSERALPLATTLARAAGATITLIHCAWSKPKPGEDANAAQQRAVGEAQTYLSGVASRLGTLNVRIGTRAPFAAPAAGILAEVTAAAADLVVMCTHGRSGVGRVLYGSVAEAVMAKSPVPVLLVHPTGPVPDLATAPGGSSVLVPLDGSALAEASLPAALDMARALGGALQLLRVVVPNVGYYPDPMLGQPYISDSGEKVIQEQTAEAEGYLKKISDGLAGDVTVQSLVRLGWPSESIVDEAHASGAKLIAMATHGHTGLADLLMGNVALDVLRRSGLPLLLVRPRDLGVRV